MEIEISTPALLFPAVSLLLLAYTNRFLATAQLIRLLHRQSQELNAFETFKRQVEAEAKKPHVDPIKEELLALLLSSYEDGMNFLPVASQNCSNHSLRPFNPKLLSQNASITF